MNSLLCLLGFHKFYVSRYFFPGEATCLRSNRCKGKIFTLKGDHA